MNSEKWFELAKTFTPGGVHSPVRSFKGLHTTPRFIKKAKGAYLYDVDGKDYLDFCMSFGPLIIGHRDKDVQKAIKKALKNGWTYGASEPYSVELAEYIVSRIKAIDQIRFTSSGTEAVMTAIRLARGFTGKRKIVKFNGCYHGHMDSMLIKAGSGLAGTATASSNGVTEETSKNTLVCELNDLNALEDIFKNNDDIAAVFIEPLPANNGLLVQDKEYLKSVQELCKKNGTLLVFDEVISGFRIAFGGMSEITGIEPDLITYGKIIGGGMPVGACAGKKEIMEKLAPIGDVYQAGTLSANPVAMVAGLTSLKKLNDQAYLNLKENTQNIVQLFSDWFNDNGFSDYQTKSYGSLFWSAPNALDVKSLAEIPSNLNERFFDLFKTLLNKGIYLAPNAYEVSFVSLAHDKKVQKELKRRLWN